jgi:predicted permease
MLHDLKYALRGIARRPGHTALIVLTLAVGLGVNTVAFSSVNALLFKPFRTVNAADFGWVFAGPPNNPYGSVSRSAFDALTTQATTLKTVVAEGRMPLSAATPAGPEQLWGLAVSSEYFSVVQAPLVLGRALSATDTTREAVPILISERHWRTRWAGAADLTTVRPVLNGQLARVIGVVGDTFQGPGGVFEPDLWFPLDAAPVLRLSIAPGDAWLTMMASLRAGVTRPQIEAQVQDILTTERAQYVPIIEGHPEAQSLRGPAALAMSAVGLVLLIACFNVAGLILARSAERQHEMGLRTALGARRARLTRQLLVEGLVLATLAGAAALLLATWSESLLGGLSLPAPIPQRLHFSMDWMMVAFTAGLVIVAATVPVLAPAWQVIRVDPIRWLKSSTAGAGGGAAPARARRAFVLLQVIASTVFLSLGLMFSTSYVSAARTDPGFNTGQVATLQIAPDRFAVTPERLRALVTDLMSRLASRPEIVDVSAATRMPFDLGRPDVRPVSIDGRDCAGGGCVQAATTGVTSSFFAAMDIPVRAGRVFDHSQDEETGTVVLNEAAAQALWPGGTAVGQWLHDGSPSSDNQLRQVVGVVANVVGLRLDRPADPMVYRPLTADELSGAVSIVARSRTTADDAGLALRAAWRDLGDTLPPAAVKTMEERMALPLWPSRVGAAFFATCGLLAVVLVGVGLFGVTYYAVAQRTREFGIRLALGATSLDLRRLVLGESLRLVAPGLVVGLLAAAGAASLARVALLGVSPLDARWYLLAAALQIGLVLLATWSPARRAARVSPQTTLRGE